MFDLFSRARAYRPLTPGERAMLRLIEGLLYAGVVAALPALAQVLGARDVAWDAVARTALGAAAVAMLFALAKYLKAHGDPLIVADVPASSPPTGIEAAPVQTILAVGDETTVAPETPGGR